MQFELSEVQTLLSSPLSHRVVTVSAKWRVFDPNEAVNGLKSQNLVNSMAKRRNPLHLEVSDANEPIEVQVNQVKSG